VEVLLPRSTHPELHAISRVGWLRASVLGANDGIVSTASLIVGVAAAGTARPDLRIAGVAALVAGAMSMAAGEYVSVSSQADAERADIERERSELSAAPELEREELAAIYRKRGLDPKLAIEVADQLMASDPLAAHARDELGISEASAARPVQAALASALAFSAGGAAPLLVVPFAPTGIIIPFVIGVSITCLAGLGMLGAKAGGAPALRSVVRVCFWGILAMALTAGIGKIFGTII
jgi:VIT1/CCC1 family predicted Fe2+/Mn2+ transporter